jgi:hypothetical protein
VVVNVDERHGQRVLPVILVHVRRLSQQALRRVQPTNRPAGIAVRQRC